MMRNEAWERLKIADTFFTTFRDDFSFLMAKKVGRGNLFECWINWSETDEKLVKNELKYLQILGKSYENLLESFVGNLREFKKIQSKSKLGKVLDIQKKTI